jgi:hypothetical protein
MAMAVTNTAMVTVDTATAMATTETKAEMAMVNMATAANPELPNYSADYNALVIIMDPLTEFWGHKLGAQSGRTNGSTGT